jgi:hypothetical protein
VTAQALVTELVLLFQSPSDIGLTAQGLKKTFWITLFTSVFSKLPFMTRTATISVLTPSDKATNILDGNVGVSGPAAATPTVVKPVNGLVIRLKVTESNSEVYGKFYSAAGLAVDMSEVQKALLEASKMLPFGGTLKLVTISSYLKRIKVAPVAKLESLPKGDTKVGEVQQ